MAKNLDLPTSIRRPATIMALHLQATMNLHRLSDRGRHAEGKGPAIMAVILDPGK